jgi:hypothetical protein
MARMPRTEDVDAWASYLQESELSVEDAMEKTASISMKYWLGDNIDAINKAVASFEEVETETAVATFVTEAKVVDKPAKADTTPARGERV